MSKADLMQKISNIPDELLVEQVNVFNYSVIAHVKLGDNIDHIQGLAFRWFANQKDWQSLEIRRMNGVSVTMVKEG
jgi:hypothetical protein